MFIRLFYVAFTLTLFSSLAFGQCNQATNISSSLMTQSCPSGTVTYQVSFSSSIPNGNNSLCYGYTISNPDGSQQTTNIGPVNQSNSTNKNWTHTFNVTINCNQGLTLFINAWSNQNCGGNMCSDPISRTMIMAPLPVELLYFRLKPTEQGHLLSWATASETNNSGFFIEYSNNAMDWETAEFIQGKGNSQQTSSYEYLHPVQTKGHYYYRLRQVDHDGTEKYSHVIHGTIHGASLSLTSNLAASTVRVISDALRQIYITDSMGKLVALHTLEQGINEIPLQDMSMGLYFMHTEDNQVYKFVKY